VNPPRDIPRKWRATLIVLSDKAASGRRPDACLPPMRAGLPPEFAIAGEHILSDDREALEKLLREICETGAADLILTSGGTGLSARDITPQATMAVADYQVPGIPEAMRSASVERVPTAMLSRAVAAVRRNTLIVNLPGSPNAVAENLKVAAPVLSHACELLNGPAGDHSIEAKH